MSDQLRSQSKGLALAVIAAAFIASETPIPSTCGAPLIEGDTTQKYCKRHHGHAYAYGRELGIPRIVQVYERP